MKIHVCNIRSTGTIVSREDFKENKQIQYEGSGVFVFYYYPTDFQLLQANRFDKVNLDFPWESHLF